ncbi:hypothetical protein BC940DRAFT_226330, partial [Gongronella butleri]
WHDGQSKTHLVYLGYPICLSQSQQIAHEEALISAVKKHCALLSWRRLSIAGNSLLANSMVLAKLWHKIRVTPISKASLQSIKRKVIDFVWPKKPPL